MEIFRMDRNVGIKLTSKSVSPKRRLIIVDSLEDFQREGLHPRKPLTKATLRRISSSAAARRFWTPLPVKTVVISKPEPTARPPEAILPLPRRFRSKNIETFSANVNLHRLQLPPGTAFNLKDLRLDMSMNSDDNPEPEVPVPVASAAPPAEAEQASDDDVQGEKLKADCIRFVRQRISYDDMWEVRKELKRLQRTKNIPRFGGLSSDARKLLFEIFCNKID